LSNGKETAALVSASHNRTPEGIRLATPEKIERVKRVMDMDEEASWYYAG
jgi:hypothetical protein